MTTAKSVTGSNFSCVSFSRIRICAIISVFDMTATAHALAGAALVSFIPNSSVALPMAFASHFVLDLVPHWDTGTYRREKSPRRFLVESVIDLLLGFGLSFLLFGSKVNPYLLTAGILVSQLPDWLEAPYLFLGWKFPPFSTVKAFQSKLHFKKSLPWGFVSQVVVITLLILLLSQYGKLLS